MKTILRRTRKGSLLLNSVILLIVLLLTGAAFLKWAVDEGYQARFDLARTQAYYIAQKGVIETGLFELRSRKAIDLPDLEMHFPDGERVHLNDYTGWNTDNKLIPVYKVLDSDIPMNDMELIEEYIISSTGVVEVRGPTGKVEQVERSFNMHVQKPSLSKYFYFTVSERTMYDEIIWFFGRDVLYGPVRSNDQIAIQGSPEFYSDVISSADSFLEGGNYSPIFHADTVLGAPEVAFENRASELRLAALAMGNYFDNRSGQLVTRIEGRSNGWHVYQWSAGTPYDPDNVESHTEVSYSNNTAIFVEGTLFLKGTGIGGRTTLGSEGDMMLIDDVRYSGFGVRDLNPQYQANVYYLVDTTPILGLVSESGIRVANTDANGKGNGASQGDWGDHSNKHIIITAALIALGGVDTTNTAGGSFDFENQNNAPTDPNGWDGYWWCDPDGEHAGEQDERGAIYLRGCILQRRRGYVHRGVNNCNGSGYEKEYAYDIRMWKTPPPYFPKEVDSDGRYDFQITDSWDQNPDRYEDFH